MRHPGSWLGRLERLRPRRLGLRKRITLVYSLGAFVLAAVLSATTFGLTRSLLIRQQEVAAIRQAYQNANIVKDRLRSNPVGADEIIKDLQPPNGTNSVILTRGQYSALTVESGRADLPRSLVARVNDQFIAAQMFTSRQGRSMLITGIPLQLEGESSYFEIARMDDLRNTLRNVGGGLTGAARRQLHLWVVCIGLNYV